MDTMIARAFLWLAMKPKERADLLAFEKSLPPGRYLQGSEICHRYGLNPKPRTDLQMEEMHRVARMYSGILMGRRRQDMKADNPKITDAELHKLIDGKIELQNWISWADFALQHFRDPRPIKAAAQTEAFVSGQDMAAGGGHD